MKIETDKYLITKEGLNIVLQLKTTKKYSHLLKDKSKIGEVALSQKTFYQNLEQCYKAMVTRMILDYETISHFDDIKNLVNELIQEVKFMKVEG